VARFHATSVPHVARLLDDQNKKNLKLQGQNMWTNLGWPSGIGLGPESVLLLKVSCLILSGANLRGLV